MKGKLCILAVSTLIIAANAFCACAPGEEYLPVTTEELIGNFTAYDGQNVKVTGVFVDPDDVVSACPLLEVHPPCVNITVEKNLDKYYPFYISPWGISSSGKKKENHVVAFWPMPDSTGKRSFPTQFEKGQQIEIRGSVHVTTIKFLQCNPCLEVIRSSLFIEVHPENVKIIPGQ